MAALARTPLAIVSLGALTLGACGELTPEEQAQSDAIIACSDRAGAAFRVLAEISDAEDESSAADFRVDPNGAFVWEASVRGKNRPLPDRLACHGNVKQRIVEVVEFNGVAKRPLAQEVWKY